MDAGRTAVLMRGQHCPRYGNSCHASLQGSAAFFQEAVAPVMGEKQGMKQGKNLNKLNITYVNKKQYYETYEKINNKTNNIFMTRMEVSGIHPTNDEF